MPTGTDVGVVGFGVCLIHAPRAPPQDGLNALLLASLSGSVDVVRALLKAGASVAVKSSVPVH